MLPVAAQDADIRDLDFQQEGLNIVVSYDLIGGEGEEYDVQLLYSSSGGEVFDYEPTAVSGAVGDDIPPGLNKKITWRVLNDFPSGIQSSAVTFKVVAEEEGGAFGWFLASLLAGSGGTAAGIATGVLPCFSFIPGSISGTLCPGATEGGEEPTQEPPPPDEIASPPNLPPN